MRSIWTGRGLARLALAPLLLSLGLSGCFYDSTWGEAKRAQRRNAAREAPAALHGEPARESGPEPARDPSRAGPEGSVTPPGTRALTARVYVTPAYLAQTVDWQRQLREQVSDANEVLVPALGARLEVTAATPWTPPVGEDDLARVLAALIAHDGAEGADVVIGLIGGLSRLTPSFHELGMAPILGKHLVVRAASKADEHDAVEHAFDELSPDERARLRGELRRHRAAAVLLHELGHNLGAIHETRRTSLMYPEYARGMESFSEEGAGLMRIGLAHRTDPGGAASARAFARELRAFVAGAPASAWVASDRADMLTRLDAVLAAPAAPPEPLPEKAVTSPSTSLADARGPAADADAEAPLPDAKGLAAPDLVAYRDAVRAHRRGAVEDAWRIGAPLFRAYPTSYEVQDLRCQLAMKRLAWAAARAECDALMRAVISKKP